MAGEKNSSAGELKGAFSRNRRRNKYKSDVQVLFRKDTEQPWEHLIITKSGNVLSDRMECRKLESIDVLRELAQCGIIELHEEKIES